MAKDSLLDVVDILNEYSRDIQSGIEKDAVEVAKKGVKRLKSISPEKTGDYKKGWKVKTEKNYGRVKSIIHNATDYQLTHLLEKPHATRTGGVTTPKVHISIVEEEVQREFEQAVEQTIKNGG